MGDTSKCTAFVVVTGQPGSGKTTLAQPLARELGAPLLSKDTIKEALADALERPNTITVETSQRLGAAAFEIVWALAAQSAGAVLEASWDPTIAADRLRRLGANVIEVHCSCPPSVAQTRYADRAHERHWVHLDVVRVSDERLWGPDSAGPQGLSASLVEVDTTSPADIPSVAREVRRLIDPTG